MGTARCRLQAGTALTGPVPLPQIGGAMRDATRASSSVNKKGTDGSLLLDAYVIIPGGLLMVI